MAHSFQTLALDQISPQVALLRLNRSDAANAINTQMALELKRFFEETRQKSCRALVLTGSGKHFSAGADLKERRGMNEAEWHTQHDALEAAVAALLACDIPVIAAINGAAFGGGFELALACDFIYASQEARFGLTETTLGIMPGMGGTQTLARRVGLARAKEMIFTGKAISTQQALDYGVANKLCAPETLIDEAVATAQAIANNGPLAIQAAKRAMQEGAALSLDKAMVTELKHYNTLLKTRDRHEGINAFNEKRKANFTGE